MSAPDLHVQRWGQGPPVVFLHGLGASGRYWERLVRASTGYAGVAPDLLGFGRSPSPAAAEYSVADHLAALFPMVPQGSVVVGHSTGAILAAALGARSPQHVRHLLLLGLPAFPDAPTARREVGRLGLLARLTVEGSPLAERLCDLMCRLRPLAIAAAPLLIRDLPPSIASDGARHTWPSYSRTLDHVVVNHRVLPDLVMGRRPTLLLHGRDDRTAPAPYVHQLVDEARRANCPVRLQVLDGDHHLAVRKPGDVATALHRALVENGALA
jgi:pimeloyl-ACP methyl ester carboxylesterase